MDGYEDNYHCKKTAAEITNNVCIKTDFNPISTDFVIILTVLCLKTQKNEAVHLCEKVTYSAYLLDNSLKEP